MGVGALKSQTRGIRMFLNKVILLGNVGADPEEKTFPNGGKIATFPLATSRRYKDPEGNILEQTSWHKIKFGNEQADRIMRIVKKGAVVQVDGSIRYENFTNKDDVEVHLTSIFGETFKVMVFPKRLDGEQENSERKESESDE